MPIGQCRACGKPVSTIPAICPHCGASEPIPAGQIPDAGPETEAAGPPTPAPPPASAAPEPAFTVTATHVAIGLSMVVAVVALWYWFHLPPPAPPKSTGASLALRMRRAGGPAPAPAADAPTPAPAPTPPSTASAVTTPVAGTMFEPAFRAEKSIESGLTRGVPYDEFETLLQSYTTELLVIRDRAIEDPERTLLRRYGEVAVTYQDSRVLWKEQLDQGVKYGWATAPERNPDALIVVEGEVTRVVQRYGLATREGPNGPSVTPDAIPALWERARTLFTAANRAAGFADPAPADSTR